jgi:acetolactate synthase-1/2/3 large subunit
VLTIGGQVPRKYLTRKDRQMGFQEVPGLEIFKSVTKMADRYISPNNLETCIRVSKTPRKGPTFLEIPDDIQRTEIHPYNTIGELNFEPVNNTLSKELEAIISKYKKPIAIIGAGAEECVIRLDIPFLYTWRTKDRFFDHENCKGGFGITEGKFGNNLLKEADLILMVGTRMDSHQVPDWDKFAPKAHKVSVGLEFPHKVDKKIECKLHGYLRIEGPDWCGPASRTFPKSVLYNFIDDLSIAADRNDIIIPDMGQTGCCVLQRWGLKKGQKLFNGMNHSPMGYSLPGSIGAAVATGRRVIVIVGDGSLMMNVHDLQTISELKLPVNIFVVNNGGYGMIRQTQDDWKEFLLQGVGCGLKIPDVKKLAYAFNLKYTDKLIDKPSIFEVKIKDTRITPKWKYGEEF